MTENTGGRKICERLTPRMVAKIGVIAERMPEMVAKVLPKYIDQKTGVLTREGRRAYPMVAELGAADLRTIGWQSWTQCLPPCSRGGADNS